MTGARSLRGNVNAILNGLIRVGVISEFETNFGDPITSAFCLHIRVVADIGLGLGAPGYDERRRKIQDRVMRQLAPVAPEVIVSVRGTQTGTRTKASATQTGKLCREGRQLLGWTIAKHAEAAGVNHYELGGFERGERTLHPERVTAIMRALTVAGVEFTQDGVRLKPEAMKRKRS